MIRLIEVGPRDGLQNEKVFLDLAARLELISRLETSGLKTIEVGAFVSAEKVPQMSQSRELLKALDEKYKIRKNKKIQFPVLVPNERGMKDALEAGASEVAVFAACSEGFSKANINCSIEESFERFKPIFELAKKNKIKVRGYLSTAFYCPYDGKTKPETVVNLAQKLLKLGCYEVSVGDTIGAATPGEVSKLLRLFKKKKISLKKIAMHFHDTRGTALANILESLKSGISAFDSSIGGLGGCPYAPGAQGNVSTEDVVFMLNGMGLKSGVNLEKLIETSKWLSGKMGKELPSKVAKARSIT